MVEDMETDDPVTRENVLKLIERKDDIEKSLKELKDVLDTNKVGMNDALVDQDGFPRQDIDVYQVRHARHKIICFQNDHKAIMQEIELGLHKIHSQSGETAMDCPREEPVKKDLDSKPIAKVNFVNEESPASLAGLQVDDFILSFGTIKHENFKSLQDIGSVVQHSVGRKVPVVVRRGDSIHRLILTPKEWSGKGLLGCNIVPIEHVER